MKRKMRATPHRKEAWTWAESIITSAKRIVKSEEADENSGGGFSQKATGTLGMESIITSAKRIVKFREADESSGAASRRKLQEPWAWRVSSLRQKEL